VLFGVMLVIVAVFAWGGFSAWQLTNSIERIPSEQLPSLAAHSGGPVNILLVGSDSRVDNDPELGGFFGDFAGERADVIILFHASGGSVQMVSLPRDLKVDIPGEGTNRINAAYAFGGPDLMVRTVQQATGLPIHHYVEVGFNEFSEVVDGLGGVDVELPFAARDNKSGLSVEAGTDELDGPQALAYVRSRTYEEFQNGAWVGLEQGDIGRTKRQQAVLSQLLDKGTSPARFLSMPSLASSVGNSITADDDLSLLDLMKIGWVLARADGIEATTLPVVDASEGGVAYLAPRQPDAAELLVAFGRGDPFPILAE
jgi:LCP family protein required for cell wall assembly